MFSFGRTLRSTPRLAVLLLFTLFGAAFESRCLAQAKSEAAGRTSAPPAVAASPAFAELVLRKTEISADLESLLVDYTEDYPKVKELRASLDALLFERDRIAKVSPTDSGKLTTALGKLMIRKVELKTELWKLLQTYKEEHPEVKRAQRRVDTFEAAIREILG